MLEIEQIEQKIISLELARDKIINSIAALEERFLNVEKAFKKSEVKSVFELTCELEELKDILLRETPTGKQTLSPFAKARQAKFKGIKRRI